LCRGQKHFYEIKSDQCGEAALDPLIKNVLVASGLSEGTCAEQGYDVTAGSKDIDLPSVGKVTLELYGKKARLRARVIEGSLQEYVHLRKVSTDRCAEAFIHPLMKGSLVETEFSEGTCAGQGYDLPAGREEIDIPYIGGVDIIVDLELYSKRPLASAMPDNTSDLHNAQSSLENKIHMWKAFSGRCGEALIDSMTKGALVELDFVEGTCAEQGFNVAAGGKEIDVSSVGNVTLKLYDQKPRLRSSMTEGSIDEKLRLRVRIVEVLRPPHEGSLENHVHLCKVSDDHCSETFIDSTMLGALAETKFSEGTCAEQGYTVPAGTDEINVPYIGGVDILVDVHLYSKPSRRLLLV